MPCVKFDSICSLLFFWEVVCFRTVCQFISYLRFKFYIFFFSLYNCRNVFYDLSYGLLWLRNLEWVFVYIIGLLLDFFLFISSSRFLLRPYDVTTTSNLLFVHSFMQFQLNCVRDVIFRSWWSEFFCSFAWLIFWSHLTYLTLKNDFLTLKLTLFTLIQRDKVRWACFTLNEGY